MSIPSQMYIPPDEDRSIQFTAATFTTIAIASVCLVLRLFSRWAVTKNLGIDDAVLATTLSLAIVDAAVTQTQAVPAGMGRHAIYVGPEGIATIIKWITITSYISIVLVVATKYAIVILLCKIMAPSRPGRWFLWGLMGLLTVVAVIAIALVSVECVPLERLWNPFLPGSCGLLNVAANFAIFTGALSSFSDLVLALFPISILWSLQIKLKKKIGICVVMGLGVLASTSAAIKTSKLTLLTPNADYSWIIVDLVIWTCIEINLMIACASAPALLPLYRVISDPQYRITILSSFRRKKSSSVSGDEVELRAPAAFKQSDAESDTRPKPSKTQILRSTEIRATWTEI